MLENDRAVVAGARLVGKDWQAWQPPCADVAGPAYIAASSADDLVAACDVGQWSTPEGGHLFVSHDGGVTFAATGTRTPFDLGSNVAAPAATTVMISGLGSPDAVVEASFDGGRTWKGARVGSGSLSLTDLGFTTKTQGVVIATDEGRASQLFMTRDGGRSWSPVGG